MEDRNSAVSATGSATMMGLTMGVTIASLMFALSASLGQLINFNESHRY